MLLKNFSVNRIGRYLIEIIIIIIGISLSFALDDWDKRRNEQKEYRTHLENMLQDIKIDSLQMVNDFNSYWRKDQAVDLVLRFSSWENPDSILALDSGVSSLSNFVEFLPNNNTFQMLSSTGGFKVFTNPELVSELIQLYKYDYAYIKMMGEEADKYRSKYLEPFLMENIYFEDRFTFPNIRTDVRKIIEDRTFRNICINYQGGAYSAMNSYRRAITRMRKSHDLIVEELSKLE